MKSHAQHACPAPNTIGFRRTNAPSARVRRQGKRPTWATLTLLFCVATSFGCAANHSLLGSAPIDVGRLVTDLEAKPQEEDALFDLTYLPLLHLDLRTFSRSREQSGYPEGHEFLSMRSWLPLFLVVLGQVEYYDTQHTAYERNEFTAILWGLWASSQTTLQTLQGERVERTCRLLWIFDWGKSVEYTQP